LQFKRNKKAITAILAELSEGKTTEAAARVYLGGIGLTEQSIDAFIADAIDGSGALETIKSTEASDGQVKA
jgi:hypothetical protein